MATLEKEINKLIPYKKEGEVTAADVDAVCTKTLEAKVFDLVKEIGMKNISKAIEIYRTLLIFNEPPLKILALISRQFKIMLQCKVLTAQGKDINEIKDIISQNYYAVKECSMQCRNFTEEMLKNAIYECLETDMGIKSGKIEAQTALEIIIAKYGA